MSKIKTGGLDQYGADRFKTVIIETAGVEGVNDSPIIKHVRNGVSKMLPSPANARWLQRLYRPLHRYIYDLCW